MKAMNYCPKCKSEELLYDSIKIFYCPKCSWEYYHNTAAAVAGIIEFKDKVLVVERNMDPGKGMLDFPGGFVDPLESAEDALKREIKEELDIELNNITYLCSAPNKYEYKNIHYSTCDLFYTARVETDLINLNTLEISSYKWISKFDLNSELFAFISMQEAINKYLIS